VTFLASAPGRNSQNSPVVITPQAYGAVSGGGDAAAAFQAAVTAAETAAASGAPVTVWIDGVFTLDNASYAAINLSRNNSGSRGWVNIVGAANAKIILSANTSRFLYLNKIADYDTFQKIRIERLEIDAGNTAGKGGVILGNVQTNGNTPTRLNFANIVVRDVKATNLYEEDTTATSQRMGIMLIGNHAAALEATQTSTTDILIEGVDVYGGAGCANVCSFGGTLVGGVNHYYNNVRFRRVRHVVATAPVNTGSQTSFFITGTGFGDYCEIIDAYSKNISDDAIEIGAMQTVLLERCRLEDPFLIGVMAKNFHPAIDTARQVITCTDVIVIGTVAGRTAATDGGVRCVAFSLADDGNEYGTIRLIRPQYYLDGSSSAHALPSQKAQFFGVDTVNVRRVEIYQPKVVYNNYTDDRTGSHDTHVVYFSSSYATPKLLVRDADIRFDGLSATTTSASQISIIRVEGHAECDIDGVDLVIPANTWTSGFIRVVDIGRGFGSIIGGRVRRLRPRIGLIGGIAVYGCYINSTTTLTVTGEIEVSDCEFSGLTNSSGEVVIDSTQVGKVRSLANGLRAGQPAVASVTPGASPYTYQTTTGYPQQITVSGGTVSLIEVQALGGSFFTTGLTSGTFLVRQGHRLRITYSSAPTMIAVPQN
jgi:hypothetical protein